MLLVAGMFFVPLASLVNVDDAVPGVRVQTSPDDDALDLNRSTEVAEASRSGVDLLGPAETAAMTAVPTTSTSTTAAPTTTAKPTTTTAKPTTTTAKPTTTTARPTTTTAKPTTTTAKPTTTTAKPTTTTTSPSRTEEGDASYYQASDPAECAHRTLAFGTVVKVTNLENGNSTTCHVGDRGPYVDGRVIDLSSDKFAELAPLSEGVIRVRIEW